MKRLFCLYILMSLAALAFAEPGLRVNPAPAAPYVMRHSALDKYPLKHGDLDQLSWTDFGLQGKVSKMYIQTSDIIWEPSSLRDHVIVRFDSLGSVQTTISYPHSPDPLGFRYLYRPDGQLERVERYSYQDGFDTATADVDSIFAPSGSAADYFYDEQGYLARIVFYDDQGVISKEQLYSYSADGYKIEVNYAVESRRERNLIYVYDRQGRLVASQKKDLSGKFINTAKYSFDTKNNSITALQDYLNDAPTQKRVDILDAAGRLKESTINDPQGNLMRKYSYTYDADGRLVQQIYSSPNDKITTIYSYTVDEQGNLTEYSASQDKGMGNFSLNIRYEYY